MVEPKRSLFPRRPIQQRAVTHEQKLLGEKQIDQTLVRQNMNLLKWSLVRWIRNQHALTEIRGLM